MEKDDTALLITAKRRFHQRLTALQHARARGDAAAFDMLHRALWSDAAEIGHLLYDPGNGSLFGLPFSRQVTR
jgi:hypothetical protein